MKARLDAMDARLARIERMIERLGVLVKQALPPATQLALVEGTPSTPPSATELKLAKKGPAIGRLFAQWQTQLGHTRAVLDAKRRSVIARALDHYPEADLASAIRGVRHSPHHMGTNDESKRFDDIELILRDAKHIEEFRRLDEQEHGTASAASEDPRVAALRDEADRALQEGKTSEYNAINARIADLSRDRERGTGGPHAGRSAAAPARVPRADRRDH